MRRVIGTVAVIGVLALSGCGGGDPLPTLPPTPSLTPVFASEEEALAAAEEAYREYWAVVNQVSNEGGADPDRIVPFVTQSHLPDELDGFQSYSDKGIHSEGRAVVSKVVLQQFVQSGDGYEISFYSCIDVRGVVIRDSNGTDVTPSGRPALIPLEVVMEGSAGEFLVSSSDQWPDSQFCS